MKFVRHSVLPVVLVLVSLLAGCGGGGGSSSGVSSTASSGAVATPTATPATGKIDVQVQFGGAKRAGKALSPSVSAVRVHLLDASSGAELPGSPTTVPHTVGSTTPIVVTFSAPTGTYTVFVEGLDANAAVVDTSVVTSVNATAGGSTQVAVSNATTVSSVGLSPTSASAAVGTAQQFQATAVMSDNTQWNATGASIWSSSDGTVATVQAGLARGVKAGRAVITAQLGSRSGNAVLVVGNVSLTSISVTPASTTIAVNTTQQYTATGTFSDGSVQDVTGQVTWTSSSASVAPVSATGLASGLATGQATVTASFTRPDGTTVSGTATLSVSSAVLQAVVVSPATATVPKGATQQFIATGQFSDGTTQDLTSLATWSAGNANATVSNSAGSKGLATAVTASQTAVIITASALGKSGTASLTVTPATLVSVRITPVNPAVPAGLQQQFTATATFSDNSQSDATALAAWTSSVTQAATITANGGLATTLVAGVTTIGCSLTISGVTQTDSTTLKVTPAKLSSLAVTPASATVPKGVSQQFVATGTFSDGSTLDLTASATWTAGTGATVSNTAGSKGLATGVTASVTPVPITAAVLGQQASGNLTVNAAALVSVRITPVNPSIAAGLTQQFTATATFSDSTQSDLTSSATWTSGTPGVATINANSGLATSVAAGTSTIGCSLTVSGVTKTDSTVLTVTTATLSSISVTPASPSIALGTTQQFTATGTFSDSSTQDLTSVATWTPTNGNVTVSNLAGSKGLATGAGVTGAPVTVTATALGKSGNAQISVTAKVLTGVRVTPVNPTAPKGATQQFTATATYSDNSSDNQTANATWSSGTPGVATITANGGLATAVAPGTSTIGASLTISGVTRTDSTSLTVTPAPLTALLVSLKTVSSSPGSQRAFRCQGTYADGSTSDVTSLVTWSSSDTTVAQYANLPSSPGVFNVVGSSGQNATITATLAVPALSDTATLNVRTKVVLLGNNNLLSYPVTASGTLGAQTGLATSPAGAGVGLDRLVVDPTGTTAYALTNSSKILTVPLNNDGTFGTITSATTSIPAGTPNSNAGSIVVTPDGKYIYVTNGDTNIYQFSVTGGVVTPLSPASLYSGLGTTSRLAMDPAGRNVYVGGLSASGNYAAFTIGANGLLTPAAGSPYSFFSSGASTVSTIAAGPGLNRLYGGLNNNGFFSSPLDAAGLPTSGTSTAYSQYSLASAVTPDGRFFFACGTTTGNLRLAGNVASYSALNGLSNAQTFSSQGNGAYDLAMDPSGGLLYVVNRSITVSGAIVPTYRLAVFGITGTGGLTSTANLDFVGPANGGDPLKSVTVTP